MYIVTCSPADNFIAIAANILTVDTCLIANNRGTAQHDVKHEPKLWFAQVII